MVNLDLSNLDTITNEHLRVLQAIEQGMRNHRYVPAVLINQIAGSRSIGLLIRELLKMKLVEHVGADDAYCLSFLGYDYLAMTVLKKRHIIENIGARIGIGKEADVYIATTPTGLQIAVKFHKLGLASFKTAKSKRSQYLENRKSASWMYFSRLSAVREFGFMAELKRRQFKVPQPFSINRHAVAMQYVEGFAMHKLRGLTSNQAANLGWELWLIMVKFLKIGVVHGDCNEYNVIVQINDKFLGLIEECDVQQEDQNSHLLEQDVDQQSQTNIPLKEIIENCVNPINLNVDQQFINNVVVIDFPQMISIKDEEAAFQFDRDIASFEPFLNRRFDANVKFPRYVEIFSYLKFGHQMETTEKSAIESGKLLDQDIETDLINEEQQEIEEGMREPETQNIDSQDQPTIIKKINVRDQVRKEALKQEHKKIQKGRYTKGQARGRQITSKNKGALNYD